MAEFINTVNVIGDDALTDSIIDRSVAEYKDNNVVIIGMYAFYDCSQLTTVDIPAVTSIDAMAFYMCRKLTVFIMRSATVCRLINTSAFLNTPIKSGTGYIYVPSALVDSYKAATNWSTYAARFRALEDYTVDGTTTGELDPNEI